jgi:RimJ/RimL family protein N-acetyltransferase
MIRGEYVTLRPVAPADLPALRHWFNDPAVMRFWGRPRPLVLPNQFDADLPGRFAGFDDAGYFTIEDPSGRPIGRIEFERLDERNRSAELMILIGEPDALGRGFGRDAVRALLTYLFRDRNLYRVELTVLPDNKRAIRSYQRSGFSIEGTLRDHRFVDGRYVDELQMSILRHEFENNRVPSTPDG